MASAVADWSSSSERRDGFLSRARRVAVCRLRSGKGVSWGGDVVAGLELMTSAILGEDWDGGEEE